MRISGSLLCLALAACGAESSAPTPTSAPIEVSPTTEFNKLSQDVTVDSVRVNPDRWEPFTEPKTSWRGFRVKRAGGAGAEVLRVTQRWKSGATRVNDLRVAPGGYVIEDENRLLVVTRPPSDPKDR